MVISIISGKGGTGKTTIAVNLAAAYLLDIQDSKENSLLLLDCDVEEPNAALFLNPEFDCNESVHQPIPVFDEQLCTHCGRCAEVCRYHAIAVTKEKLIFFSELCHACGSCVLNCPDGAITETQVEVGVIQHGWAEKIEFAHGRLNIGQPSSVPIIRHMKAKFITNNDHPPTITIIDSSPGVTCPVVASLHGSDIVLLVTEPTPFGLHDLRQAYQLVHEELNIPAFVVINKCDLGDNSVDQFCNAEKIPIVMRVPFKREYANTYSKGELLVQVHPELHAAFAELVDFINQQRLKKVQL